MTLLWVLPLSILACPRMVKTPSPSEPITSGATIIKVQTQELGANIPSPSPPATEWDRMVATIDAARPQSLACYQEALRRNPDTYGEIIVRLTIDAEGRARDATALLDTAGDPQLTACVEGIVQNLQFPLPSVPGISGRYPFVFFSDRTPPEVIRTLQNRYFNQPPPLPQEDRLDQPLDEPGTVRTW